MPTVTWSPRFDVSTTAPEPTVTKLPKVETCDGPPRMVALSSAWKLLPTVIPPVTVEVLATVVMMVPVVATPAAFRPERFVGRPNAFLTDDAFIPFRQGPRVCVGASFAMTEAAVVLGTLLRRYRLFPAEGEPAMPVAVVSIRPDRPCAFRLVER